MGASCTECITYRSRTIGQPTGGHSRSPQCLASSPTDGSSPRITYALLDVDPCAHCRRMPAYQKQSTQHEERSCAEVKKQSAKACKLLWFCYKRADLFCCRIGSDVEWQICGGYVGEAGSGVGERGENATRRYANDTMGRKNGCHPKAGRD